jgi:hemolysin III
MRRFIHHLQEPASALTHLFGALASAAGLVLLLVFSRGQPAKAISLAVYGVCMIALFSASTLFHGLRAGPRARMFLNRLDHVAIFLLIAGTYTPIIYNLFPEGWRPELLTAIWLLAAVGSAYKLLSSRIHGFFNASVYPALAWAGVVPALLAYRVWPVVTPQGALLLGLGGLFYMVGFVVYYRKRPDPWPAVFGHHEIWHLFVLAGSLCHYIFMLIFVVPA